MSKPSPVPPAAEEPSATPGPWFQSHRRGRDGMYHTEVYDKDGATIATLAWYAVDQGGGVIGTAREANARLIAAAPEMLTMLKRLRAITHLYIGAAFGEADALIAKAEDAIAENAQPLIERGEANASEPDPPQGS